MSNNKCPVKRIPCVYKNVALMPVKASRAYSLVEKKRAIFVKDKRLGTYLRMKEKPSGFETQKLALGIDIGTMWDGYSIVNWNNSHNFELEHTRKIKDRNFIKKKTKDMRAARRLRRSRKWHREARFDNRTGRKYTYTMNYYFQDIKNMVDSLMALYPVSHIVIEDVAAVHNKAHRSGGFSPLEQIKTRLYDHCSSVAELIVSKNNPKLIRQFQTKLSKTNGNIRFYDMKLKDKSAKSFYAHCIDSHSLACLAFGEHLPFTEDMLYISRKNPGVDSVRRTLRKEQAKPKTSVRHLSKLKKIRVKIDDKQGNHGPWKYLYTERQYTKSKTLRCYGSSIKLSKSWQTDEVKYDQNKYRVNNTGPYLYYTLEHIKHTAKNLHHVKNYLRGECSNSSLD